MVLNALVGNQNIERVLLFLLVNERCYGMQLQALFGGALTPIQRALTHLEKHGVLKSSYEGKKRIYQLHEDYSLKSELEALLQKAYTQLSPSDRKKYCYIQSPSKQKWDRYKLLKSFWESLLKVKNLQLTSKAKQGETLQIQTGQAIIHTVLEAPKTLLFEEKGIWHSASKTAFSNTFRWTLNHKECLITLEHLRHGIQRPVFLFNLTPVRPGLLESVDAHLCGVDTYLGHLNWDAEKIVFYWRIIGLKKNDELTYTYTH